MTTNVLVTVASRHGSTAELATELGARLRESGHDRPLRVEVRPVEEVERVDGYDAVVLGSAVYLGQWLPSARDFALTHAAALRQRPLWLFSSGPVGEPLKPDASHVVDLGPVLAAVTPIEHRVFAGRIERQSLGLAERVVVRGLRVPPGDYRDWRAVREWAAAIGAALADSRSIAS